MAGRCTPTRAQALRSSVPRAPSSSMRSSYRWCSTLLRRQPSRSQGPAAKAATSARWPRTSAPRWAAGRTWARCAAPTAAASGSSAASAWSGSKPSPPPPPAAGGRGGAPLSTSLERLQALPEAGRLACLQPPQSLLTRHLRVTLDSDNAARFLSGLPRHGAWPDAPAVAVFGADPPALLGVGHIAGGCLLPDRLLSALEIAQILASRPQRQDCGILEET